MLKRYVTWVAAAGILASSTELATASSDPKLANLPKEIQSMHCLVGTWRGSVKFRAGDIDADVKLNLSCQATSSNYGVKCEARFRGLPGGGERHETDLFGYDASRKQYHWFAVSDMGETHDHVAEIPSSPTIEWIYRGLQDGKPLEERIRMTFSEDGKQLQIQNDGTVGGAPAWTFAGTATKG